MSPVLANIALSMLDEHLNGPWKPGGTMSTEYRRAARRRKRLPTWRIVRYADDFVVLVHGTQDDTEALRDGIAVLIAPMGLRLSEAKTRVTHMADGFDFLGLHIQWRRQRGTNKWYVYTFIADRPIRTMKAKIRALTHRQSQQDLGYVLARLKQVMHGWANYFKHPVAKNVFSMLDNFAWWRIVRMLRARHHWRWKDVRRRFTMPTGRWLPIAAGEIELRKIAAVPVPVPLPRQHDPQPLDPQPHLTTDTVESPMPGDRHVGFGERPGETDSRQRGHRAPGRLCVSGPTRRAKLGERTGCDRDDRADDNG